MKYIILILSIPTLLFGQDFNREKLIKKDTFYKSMEISYILFNISDLITTYYALNKNVTEANPITNLYIKNKPLAILIKSSTTIITLISLNYLKQYHKKTSYIVLGGLNILYSLVLYNNLSIILSIS